MKRRYVGLVGCALLCCISCSPSGDEPASSINEINNSSHLVSTSTKIKLMNCNIHSFSDHVGCEEGDIAVFLPARWADEQLSLKFIAVACDKEKPIYMTKGGVICTYSPITPADEYDAALYAPEKRTELKLKKYQNLLASIEAPESKFRSIGANRWLKVISLGEGKPIPCPVELKVTFQSLNEDGKPIGKPSETKTSVVGDVEENGLVEYPEGSVIEYAKIDKEDLLASERGLFTIISAKPYKPSSSLRPQSSANSQKQDSTKANQKRK